MVIAARGSGESPQSDWTDPSAYTKDSNKGAGQVNYDVYTRLKSNNPNLHWALDPVMYPADSVVPDLVPGQAFGNYLQSVDSGTSAVLDDIARTERVCQGGVKYLFLGYSQGAWVIHKVVNALGSKLLGKVVGVGLAGDPEFVAFQKIVRDNKLLDIEDGVSAAFDAANTGVPASIVGVTGSYCFPFDPVCQSTPRNAVSLAQCGAGSIDCPHFRYVIDGETTKEADFLDLGLPSQSVWPRLTLSKPPLGKVGTAYSWTATVKPTVRTSYTWSNDNTLPPGLQFSPDGVLSGTPTKAGLYSFVVTATSAEQRTAFGLVNLTINSGGALAVTTAGLPDATVGENFKQEFAGSGGFLPYSWKASGSALSAELNFSTGLAMLTGTPNQVGQYDLTVTVTDSKGTSASKTYTLTVVPAPAPGGSDDWLMFGHDAGMTFYNPGEQTLNPGNVGNLRQQWAANQNVVLPDPVVMNGVVYRAEYVLTSSGAYQYMVGAYSLSSGSQLWSVPGRRVWAAGNNEILVQSDNVLFALNLDGTTKWTHRIVYCDGCGNRLLVDGNTIIDTLQGSLESVDAATGQQNWFLQLHGNNEFVVKDGLIVLATRLLDANGTNPYEVLEAINEVDASLVWRLDRSSCVGDVYHLVAIGSQFMVQDSCTGALETRELQTGAFVSQITGYGQSDVNGSTLGPTATDGATLYAATQHAVIGDDGNTSYTVTMRAFTGSTEQWHTVLSGNSYPMWTVLANGVLYVGTYDGTTGEQVFALRAESGQVLWSSPTLGQNTYNSVEVAGGHLIIGPLVFGL
jgi:outer membrane protein assembly factor BamB